MKGEALTRLFDHSAFTTAHAELLDLLETSTDSAQIARALTHLQETLRTQFGREEHAMQEAGFTALEAHKKDHDGALERLSAKVHDWQGSHDQNALLDYLSGPFTDWFVRHVNSRDFITAQRLSLGV
jgi:hemerythrin-like metal-binding protein